VGGSFRCLLHRRASSRAAFRDLVTHASRLFKLIRPHSFTDHDAVLSHTLGGEATLSHRQVLKLEGRTIVREIIEARLPQWRNGQRKSYAGHTRSRRFQLSLLHRRDGARRQPSTVPFWFDITFGSTQGQMSPNHLKKPVAFVVTPLIELEKCSCKSLNSFLIAQIHSCIPLSCVSRVGTYCVTANVCSQNGHHDWCVRVCQLLRFLHAH